MSNAITEIAGTFLYNAGPSFDGVAWVISNGNVTSRKLTEMECVAFLADLGWDAWEIKLVMDVVAEDEFLAWAEQSGYAS